MISFFQLPKGIIQRLDYFRSRFFWQGDSEKRKYRLAKWSVVCRPKDQGWLGIHDLEVKNRALLGKWLFKLLAEEGVWQISLGESTWAHKRYLRFCWNLVIHTFGLALWPRRSSSSHTVRSQFRMVRKLDSGSIYGWVSPRSENNIRLCTILCDTKVTRSLRWWELPHRMFRSEEAYLDLDKHLGMHCFSVWNLSSWLRGRISFNGFLTRIVNSLLILCTKF